LAGESDRYNNLDFQYCLKVQTPPNHIIVIFTLSYIAMVMKIVIEMKAKLPNDSNAGMANGTLNLNIQK